jgi:L-alanine-DL-glutamate epimerase-like enolase superfamily enzyme
MARLAQRLHLFGRNGPHVYALSALDIALWDIMGKAANLPLWRLLGGAPVGALPAYASLLRYSAPAEVAKACAHALDQGYRAVKLHEIDVPQVAAARDRAANSSRGWNEAEHDALAPHFRLRELGGSNRPVESGAQLLGRLQRQLDPRPRTGVEVRVDEVERDDVAQGRMARVVIGNHRLR